MPLLAPYISSTQYSSGSLHLLAALPEGFCAASDELEGEVTGWAEHQCQEQEWYLQDSVHANIVGLTCDDGADDQVESEIMQPAGQKGSVTGEKLSHPRKGIEISAT